MIELDGKLVAAAAYAATKKRLLAEYAEVYELDRRAGVESGFLVKNKKGSFVSLNALGVKP